MQELQSVDCRLRLCPVLWSFCRVSTRRWPPIRKHLAALPVNLLYPLTEFYKRAGRALPRVRRLDPAEMSQPYRRLLVHERDMTPTLEAAWGQSIHLRVLEQVLRDDLFSRQVVLVLDGDQTEVEMGAIQIHLERFAEQAREMVLEGSKPLGTILRIQGMAHRSRPAGFFEVAPDALISEALQAGAAGLFYGRQNRLLDSFGQVLAEVVEILPPRDPCAARPEL